MAEDIYETGPLSDVYRKVAPKWVEAHAAWQLLEETKSHVLQRWAQDLVKSEMLTGAEAERRVKASDKWRQHVEAIVEAEEKALTLKCKLEYIRMKFTERNSEEASRRAEMKLV